MKKLSRTQLLALGATARIALLGGLGCTVTAGSGNPDDPATAGGEGRPPAPTTEPTSPPPPEPVTEGNDPERAPLGRMTEQELERCSAVLAGAFPAEGDGNPKSVAMEGGVPQEVLDCCDARATHQDVLFTEYTEAHQAGERVIAPGQWAERGQCCEALGWGQHGSMTCMPWGPPPPPAVGEEQPVSVRPPAIDLRRAARSRGLVLGAVGEATRAPAIATWHGRMVNEHQSAPVFERLARQLSDAGFDDAVVDRFAHFADEERDHGVACGAVVEALGAEARAEGLAVDPLPEHPDVSRREAALRNVLSVCCLSETVAVALIGAERLDMPEGSLRTLLTGLWADEIGHANEGWRLLRDELAGADASMLLRLGQYLRAAFAALEEHELALLPSAARIPEGGEALGLCDGRQSRTLFHATVERVIVPGLERLGLPAREAWVQRGIPARAAA